MDADRPMRRAEWIAQAMKELDVPGDVLHATIRHVVVHRPATVVLSEVNPGVYRVFSTANYMGMKKGDVLDAGQVRLLIDALVDVEIN